MVRLWQTVTFMAYLVISYVLFINIGNSIDILSLYTYQIQLQMSTQATKSMVRLLCSGRDCCWYISSDGQRQQRTHKILSPVKSNLPGCEFWVTSLVCSWQTWQTWSFKKFLDGTVSIPLAGYLRASIVQF